jgi:(2R)-sulfolactate sulfo-lyase subunit alpha
MFDGRLGPLDWTETRPLSEGASAFATSGRARRRAQDHSQTMPLRRRSCPIPHPEIPHLLVHEQADNVGVVVVEGLTAGTDMLCCITHDNSTFRLTAGADVPIGHKIALKDLKGRRHRHQVRRGYRQDHRRHSQGRHVHTHNCKTKRW